MSGVLVHEWLAPRGGSENVFEEMSRIYPDAERFCLWNDSDGRFEGVRETWLARTPLRGRKAPALPLMPLAWRGLPAVDAEWILCSSHSFSHHARFRGPAADAPKLVYAYTPARYVWLPELDGRGDSVIARAVSTALKPIDRRRAQEAHAVVGISRFVADRIAVTWEREAEVIYPPVDVARFAAEPVLDASDLAVLDALPQQFLLGASRFVSYKRLDRAIEAGAAAGLPVVIAGSGPDEQRLRETADRVHPGGVTFVLAPSTPLLSALYRRALALVFAPVEDFGIVPVEAMAAGTPAIVDAVGGASETVVDGLTGVAVRDWTPDELRAAVEKVAGATSADCSARAAEFGVDVFADRLVEWVDRSTRGARSAS